MAIAAFKMKTFSNPVDLWQFVKSGATDPVTTITALIYDVGSCQYVLFYV